MTALWRAALVTGEAFTRPTRIRYQRRSTATKPNCSPVVDLARKLRLQGTARAALQKFKPFPRVILNEVKDPEAQA